MNRIWVRLALSYAALVLGAILLVTFVTGQVLELALRREAARQMATRGGWSSASPSCPRRSTVGRIGEPPWEAVPGLRLVVADARGRIVYDWRGGPLRRLTAVERRLAVPIHRNGVLIGYVLPMAASALTEEYAALLRGPRRTVLLTGIVSGIGALLISLAISDSIGAPIRRLVAGSLAIAAGHLATRIAPCGPRETREMAGAFNQMAAALEDAERHRREMTAGIAHELRTPLSVLQGNLSAMLDGVYKPSEEEIAALYDEVLRLNRLVQDLAQLDEAESGQLKLHLETVDLSELLERATTLFRPAAEAKGLTVVSAWPPRLPSLQTVVPPNPRPTPGVGATAFLRPQARSRAIHPATPGSPPRA